MKMNKRLGSRWSKALPVYRAGPKKPASIYALIGKLIEGPLMAAWAWSAPSVDEGKMFLPQVLNRRALGGGLI